MNNSSDYPFEIRPLSIKEGGGISDFLPRFFRVHF